MLSTIFVIINFMLLQLLNNAVTEATITIGSQGRQGTAIILRKEAFINLSSSSRKYNIQRQKDNNNNIRNGIIHQEIKVSPPNQIMRINNINNSLLHKYFVIRSPLLLVAQSSQNSNDSGGGNGGVDIDPSTKLLLCILIDIVGIISFAAPGLGETTDVAWAPISAVLVNYLFGNGIFTALAFVEELLPGFDIIPTATIAWFIENGNKEVPKSSEERETQQQQQTGSLWTSTINSRSSNDGLSSEKGRKKPDVSDAIDVEIID